MHSVGHLHCTTSNASFGLDLTSLTICSFGGFWTVVQYGFSRDLLHAAHTF